MEAKDRLGNCIFIGAALIAWMAVAQIVTTTYPRENPTTGLVGAGMIGLACGLTAVPLFWLVPFARHRRIALLGRLGPGHPAGCLGRRGRRPVRGAADPGRAEPADRRIRRGLVMLAEITLSTER